MKSCKCKLNGEKWSTCCKLTGATAFIVTRGRETFLFPSFDECFSFLCMNHQRKSNCLSCVCCVSWCFDRLIDTSPWTEDTCLLTRRRKALSMALCPSPQVLSLCVCVCMLNTSPITVISIKWGNNFHQSIHQSTRIQFHWQLKIVHCC